MRQQIATLEVYVEWFGPSTIHIPTEVCENVIGMLYDPWGHSRDKLVNTVTLYNCALVCRDWRVRSQRVLFYFVRLYNRTSLHRLSIALDAAQHLRSYVYHVELTGFHLHHTTSILALFPPVFAGKLPNLERVDVVHLLQVTMPGCTKTLDPSNDRSLPYIPLHTRFTTFLSSFMAVSELVLLGTTFRSFSELARMIHGLPDLKFFKCLSVRWITSGGAHPGADLTPPTEQADGVAGMHPVPRIAPKLHKLQLWDVTMYGAERLIWTRGSHLTWLDVRIPLWDGPEERVDGARGIDLSSCTGLQTLVLSLTQRFSMDKHAGLVKGLVSSWKPHHWLEPVLKIRAYQERECTRRCFADILGQLGSITDAWLQVIEGLSQKGESGNGDWRQYRLCVHIYDWESEEEWWLEHLHHSFPTWDQLGRLGCNFDTPRGTSYQWADSGKRSPRSDTIRLPPERLIKIPQPR